MSNNVKPLRTFVTKTRNECREQKKYIKCTEGKKMKQKKGTRKKENNDSKEIRPRLLSIRTDESAK